MTAPLVFLDTETTGLSLDDDIWEFAGIRREPDGTERELHLFIQHDREKALRLPPAFLADHDRRFDPTTAVDPVLAAERIHRFLGRSTSGRVHVVGAVPNFDTERLSLLLSRWGWSWPAHYHLIDVENLAVGYLARSGDEPDIPWDSDEISRAIGVEPPADERHTAMGDARWAMAIYDRVIGIRP